VERAPSVQEIERLRLVLSTYQDGTGMLAAKEGKTLPGWRDFERAVALAFDGDGPESKAIFDVLLTSQNDRGVKYGLSCKMRQELNRIGRDGRVTLELSNSAGQFWDQLALIGITTANYKQRPQETGKTLIDLVRKWHTATTTERNAVLDLARSCYLVLSWNIAGLYQLHQFSLQLPNPEELTWYFPVKTIKGVEVTARHINGDDADGRVFEWYGESGGQLKFYPKASSALWQSEKFRLEPLPDIEHGILAKVAAYFPELWQGLQ
jgi:hypothetical protein